jgi:hypothetical protein
MLKELILRPLKLELMQRVPIAMLQEIALTQREIILWHLAGILTLKAMGQKPLANILMLKVSAQSPPVITSTYRACLTKKIQLVNMLLLLVMVIL